MDEYQILERVKDWYRTTSIKPDDNFLLNDTTIISYESYKHSYEHNPSISKRVIGYVKNDKTNLVSELEFPMLSNSTFISDAYLYKKGYVIKRYGSLGPAPLPNLKYIIYCITANTGYTGLRHYEFKDRLVIELVDLDVAANNVNLPKIMSSVLGPKLLSENSMIEHDKFFEINEHMYSQKLFADHTWGEADDIAFGYFVKNRRKLLKEVLKISEVYQQVFRPYRVVYDTKTWQPVLM